MYRLAAQPHSPLSKLTIDGPSASGKSSVSLHIAAALSGIPMLTGRHYRSVTHALMTRGINLKDQAALSNEIARLPLLLNENAILVVDGHWYPDSVIESKSVEACVSDVANNDDVRSALIALQQDFVARFASPESPVIIEGRDAGTRIAPDAPLRYFLSASAEARGKRRSGQRSDANLSETQRAIVERDLKDSGHDRATEETPGLIVIHTDELSQPQVVARIMQDLVRA